ncbi:hypothetical protein B6K86_08670 [Lachnospiraceae bacterium]|nr:hypothetical protein B6K86_08670 [Lachnospiraceae bacterium]
MKVTRSISTTIETEQFELGDVISFTLTTGEEVKAKAVLETPEGMLFMTVDCLKDKRKMMVGESSLISYANSDLRKKLNSEILSIFPEEIKRRMVGMRMGNTNEFDMLRIPTEREILGENIYDDEPESVRQFYGMENRRERIALGTVGVTKYWLANRFDEIGFYFVVIDTDGNADFRNCLGFFGVRPVFLLA